MGYDVFCQQFPRPMQPARGSIEERRTHSANGDVLLTRFLQELGDNTLLLELEVHLGLIGLNLDENVTRSDGVAGLLLPGTNVASLHGRRQSRHFHDLVIREGRIVSDDVGGKAGAQGIVRRGEGAPPESGAQHGEGCGVDG